MPDPHPKLQGPRNLKPHKPYRTLQGALKGTFQRTLWNPIESIEPYRTLQGTLKGIFQGTLSSQGSLGYLTEEGSAVKMKKMKHLLQAR